MNFEDQQKNIILKSFEGENNIEKAGEGSRGGKIVGHTKSGKPIYASHLKPGTKNKVRDEYHSFSKEDHSDAQNTHYKILTDAYKKHGTDSSGRIKKYDFNEFDHRGSENFHKTKANE